MTTNGRVAESADEKIATGIAIDSASTNAI
jgi:hypothetical protein